MNKLRRKRANKELSALARLSDRDIDTSDIPEIKDWSRAIQGKFYRPDGQQSFPMNRVSMPLLANSTRSLSVGLGGTHIQSTATTIITKMTSDEVVEACLEGTQEAWSEFIRRFHRLIASVVIRAARQWSAPSADLVEELIQDVYVRLCADNYRLLRAYQGNYENSFFGYLKVIASNVVHDRFRLLHSLKGETELSEKLPYETVENADSSQEREILFEEIDRILTAKASDKEKSVFLLHYRYGMTASEIATIPGINLSIKGVESLIYRLTHRLRSELRKQHNNAS